MLKWARFGCHQRQPPQISVSHLLIAPPGAPRLAVATLSVLIGLCLPALATPTTNPLPGPTGLGVIPTTQTVAPGGVEATIAYEHASISGGGHAQFEPFLNATYGFGRGEVGVSYAHEKTDFNDTTVATTDLLSHASAATIAGSSFSTNYFIVHGKYRVYENRGFAVAIGAHYYNFGKISGQSLGSTSSLYAAGSYDLRSGTQTRAQLHLGLLGQRTSGGGVSAQNAVRPFAGVEVFARDPHLSVAADYLSSNKDAVRAYSLALRYQPLQGGHVGGELGIGRQDSDTKFFASLTYRFGG